MIYQSFNTLMLGIDSELTEQEIKYIFKQINVSNSGAITFEEFDNALNEFGVPTTSTIKNVQQLAKNNQSPPQPQPLLPLDNKIDPNVMKQQVNLKVADTFYKLIIKMKQQNTTLFDVIDYYKLSEKGFINIADYDKLMQDLDGKFTKPEIELAFSFFDKNGTKNVSLKDFCAYFTSMTGYPLVQNLQNAQNIQNGQNNQAIYRKESQNSTASDNSYTHTVGINMQYPTPQFNQQGAGQLNQQQLAYLQQQQQQQQQIQQQQIQAQGNYGYATTPGYTNNVYQNATGYSGNGYGYQTDFYGHGQQYGRY